MKANPSWVRNQRRMGRRTKSGRGDWDRLNHTVWSKVRLCYTTPPERCMGKFAQRMKILAQIFDELRLGIPAPAFPQKSTSAGGGL